MMETGGPAGGVIIIVGPKHSGKTCAGKALARLWEGGAGGPETAGPVHFFDLDELVKSRTGQSPRLLYRAGPEVFRKAEAEALLDLLEGRACVENNGTGSVSVVAAGGGLADNREALALLKKSRALVVYLEVSVETAWQRIKAAAEQGGELPPFLDTADPRHTHRLLHERRGRVYRELADLTVKARDTPEETAATILGLLGGVCPGVP